MTPQALRNSILERAVEGKLVEQRADEGTAEELYQKIQAEKKRLIQEGKLKKGNPLPAIGEDEIPFEIPENWKWVRLGDVFQFINGDRGKNYPAKSKLQEQGEIPFISAVNLKDGTVDESNLLYLDITQYEKLGSGKLLMNDIVLCIRGSLGKNCIYPFEKGAIASSLVILRKYKEIDLKFVRYYLNSNLFYLETRKYDNGTAQPNLSAQNAKKILLPLPPLAEQQRIVEKIEELMPFVEAYERDWQKLEDLNRTFPEEMKKSILQEAIRGRLVEQREEEGTAEALYQEIQEEKKRFIGEGKLKKGKPIPAIAEDEIPFEIPESWKWVRLGETIDFKIGKTPPRSELQWWKSQIPWVSIADMQEDGVITDTKEGISFDALEKKFSNSISPKGTLLMSFKLTVGRVSILAMDAVHNEAIVSIYPIVDSEDIFQSYLFKVLPFITKFGETKNAIKGKTLNSKSINNLLLPLPPLAEQERIVERIEELLSLCDGLGGLQS